MSYLLCLLSMCLLAFGDLCIHGDHPKLAEGEPCLNFGPQSPRDIDQGEGGNQRVFSFAPAPESMNLCNIHFHLNSEHKSEAYSVPGAGGKPGYQCGSSESPDAGDGMCVREGSTIEVHWVYTSCNLGSGGGLTPCVNDRACGNASLRVEAKVYVLAKTGGDDFGDVTQIVTSKEGYRQVTQLPSSSDAVLYRGSTTGPSYNNSTCSNLQVTWHVRRDCGRLNLESLTRWCEANHEGPHAARELLVDPRLLSAID